MTTSDKLLVPCFIVSLVVNTVGVIVVASSAIFSPARQAAAPKAAERPAEVLIARRAVPTPKPPEPTPTPTPTPRPTPRPVETPQPKETPRQEKTPPPETRQQRTTATPKPNQPAPKLAMRNLGLGSTSKRSRGPEIAGNEVRGDARRGRPQAITEFSRGPKQAMDATPLPPAPAPEPTRAASVAPATPTLPPPTPTPQPTPRVDTRDADRQEPLIVRVPQPRVSDDVDFSALRSTTVLVSFDVDREGLATNIRIKRGSGDSGLDEACRQAVQSGKYKPAVQDGMYVKARGEYLFQFS